MQNDLKAITAFERMKDIVGKHIERGECTEREIKIATDAFLALFWSAETESPIVDAVNLYQNEVSGMRQRVVELNERLSEVLANPKLTEPVNVTYPNDPQLP